MTFTKARHLVIAGVVAAALAYLGARVGYAGMPTLPPLAGVALLLVAVVEAVFTASVRPKLQRRSGTEPLESLTAARAVALAKASALAGAIMGGLWLGLLGYVLPISGFVEAAGDDTTAAAIGLFSALALVAAGLWLEHNLRNPDEPEEEDDEQ